MDISIDRAAALLKENDNITILCHTRPDGDTLGCAFALLYALQKLGKTARVLSPDGYPDKYRFMFGDYQPAALDQALPEYVVSVDVADTDLLAGLREEYGERVELCIDHHGSNKRFARNSLVVPECAAAGEIIYQLIRDLGVEPDMPMATCLYTALSTDTGVFRYSNTTAQTLRIAADLVEMGVASSEINNAMYSCKSRRRIAAEAMLLSGVEYFFGGRCAVIYITKKLREETGADDFDLDDIPALPRSIEGVDVGATIREEDGECRVSIRTSQAADAAAICAAFGGGGHVRAAGCHIAGGLAEAKEKLLKVIGDSVA